MTRRSLLSIAVLLIVSVASSVQASIVELTFSGTYEGDISGPFSYSMTYDTSLDTNTEFFATGADIEGFTATHEMHAYSASGITTLDFEFDGLEWLLSEIAIESAFGVSAAFWLDVDLATGATPTRSLLSFEKAGGPPLHVGVEKVLAGDGNPTVFFMPVSNIGSSASALTITRSDADPIPEPASVITWTLLGVVGCIATWWKRRRKTG